MSSSQNSSRIGKPKIEKQRRHQKPGNIGYSLSYGHPLRSFTSKIVSRQGKSSSPCLFPFKSSSPLSTVRRKLITFGLYHARFNKFTRASPRRVPGMGKWRGCASWIPLKSSPVKKNWGGWIWALNPAGPNCVY